MSEEEIKPEESKEPDYKVLLEEKEAEIAEVKKKLETFENKDFNFKKLRDMTEDEKKKLSGKEEELLKRQEHLEEEQESWTGKIVEGHKGDALAVLVGDDEELRKKVIFHYDRIKDEATTKDEINKKMRDAYLLAVGKPVNQIDPIARAAAHYSGHGVVKTGSKLTEDQKDLAAKLGINSDEIKKYLG